MFRGALGESTASSRTFWIKAWDAAIGCRLMRLRLRPAVGNHRDMLLSPKVDTQGRHLPERRSHLRVECRLVAAPQTEHTPAAC